MYFFTVKEEPQGQKYIKAKKPSGTAPIKESREELAKERTILDGEMRASRLQVFVYHRQVVYRDDVLGCNQYSEEICEKKLLPGSPFHK